jgi:hypothetical protein
VYVFTLFMSNTDTLDSSIVFCNSWLPFCTVSDFKFPCLFVLSALSHPMVCCGGKKRHIHADRSLLYTSFFMTTIYHVLRSKPRVNERDRMTLELRSSSLTSLAGDLIDRQSHTMTTTWSLIMSRSWSKSQSHLQSWIKNHDSDDRRTRGLRFLI